MATHCSSLAWEIPWTEEPGRLQSMESQRVRHSWMHTRIHTHTHNPSNCARQPVDLGIGIGPGPALRKALRGFMKIRKAESFTFETSFNAWQPSTLGSPGGSVSKEFTCYAGDPGWIPRWGRFPGEGNGNPLQYSCLRNPMDRGAWQTAGHGVGRVRHDLATKLPPTFNVAGGCLFLHFTNNITRPWASLMDQW